MFKLASSPHTHSGALTSRIMLWVMGAMLPALFAEVYYFGYGVLIQSTLALIWAFILELIVTKLRHKPTFFYVKDYSGSLTALILAMAIPPYAPYWIILMGITIAILLGKQVYGGLGQNLFNPAMVGYAVLLVSFPVPMTTWMPPVELLKHTPSFMDSWLFIFTGHNSARLTLTQLTGTIDGLSQATPLNDLRTALEKGVTSLNEIKSSPIFADSSIFGPSAWTLSIGWTQVNLCFLAGGLFLLYKRIIHWQIPTALLVTFAICCSINWCVAPLAPNPIWELLSGATMFGAFFIATDPVTASITPRGKLIFGALVGLLLYIIRYYGGYPDAIAFAVLLANICVPLIDQYTRPNVSGHRVKGM